MDVSQKRENYLSWNDYFMSMAILTSKRSKDPITQVGACIVNEDNIIVGLGYNGFPNGCSDDIFPWKKDDVNLINSKHLYVCHAETNAILNKSSFNLKNCTMYVSLFPCNECAKIIIQSKIKKIFYLSDKNEYKPQTKASKRMFDAVGIKYEQYKPNCKEIVISF